MTTAKSNKVIWISILRGITITLVVMNHVRMLNPDTGGDYALLEVFNKFLEPIRIPTFVFASGALLYLTRIKKGWTSSNLYLDKIKHIGFPLIFCTILGCIMQIIFNGFVKTPKEVTLITPLISLIDFLHSPWPHRWYLLTLLEMMAFYPLFKHITTKSKSIALFLLLIAIYTIDFHQYSDTDWGCIFTLNKYIPFFFMGITFFRFNLFKYFDNIYGIIVPLVSYPLLYLYIPRSELCHILLAITGIVCMVSISIQLSKIFPNLLSSYREHIFQIYLFGIAFQAFVELILWRSLGCPKEFVYIFYLINILFGIYAPVLISKIVNQIPFKYVRLCFGLK